MARGRKTGGRQKGTKNKRTEALEEAARRAIAGLPDGFTSLQLFQAVYRDDSMDVDTRMSAAEKALPYEHPRLSAVQHTGKNGGPIETTDLSALTLADVEKLNELAERVAAARNSKPGDNAH